MVTEPRLWVGCDCGLHYYHRVSDFENAGGEVTQTQQSHHIIRCPECDGAFTCLVGEFEWETIEKTTVTEICISTAWNISQIAAEQTYTSSNQSSIYDLATHHFEPICPNCSYWLNKQTDYHQDGDEPAVGWSYYECQNCKELIAENEVAYLEE